LAASGAASVVAPDFFGFGRSDKPVEDSVYTFGFHREFLLRFVDRLDLRNITLVVQDWGGTLGLTLPVDPGFRTRLDRLFVMNTVLPIGEPLGPHFYEWRSLVRNTPDLPVGQWIRDSGADLTERELAAYDAPFPDRTESPNPRQPCGSGPKNGSGARSWPSVPMTPTWTRCTCCANRSEIVWTPLVVAEAGHVLQEWGEPVTRAALRYFGDL
jgi:pimeloyl-ACP methyl ester carboxylesterase